MRLKIDPNQKGLFHEDQPSDDDGEVRHAPRERWFVTVHPRNDRRNRNLSCERTSEEDALRQVELYKRVIGSGSSTIVLQRNWREQRHEGNNLVVTIWYRENGKWVADEQR